MTPDHVAIAKACLAATHDGTLSFPQIIGQLIAADFEGYSVDYRRSAQSFYRQDGTSIDLALPHTAGPVAERFDAAEVERLIRWAQADAPDYRYTSFSGKAVAAGCAGYLVSFLGQRVVYYGRTGETHVELFRQ